jgi:multicomponent Na+:H+ antiporter subunit F
VSGFLLGSAIAIGVALLFGLHRVWQGPTVFDRLVAVALVTANGLVILVLVASYLDRMAAVVDIAIAYALLAFTLPIALGKHFESRSPHDRGDERENDVGTRSPRRTS